MTPYHILFLLAGILAIVSGAIAANGHSWFHAIASFLAGVLLVLISFNAIN